MCIISRNRKGDSIIRAPQEDIKKGQAAIFFYFNIELNTWFYGISAPQKSHDIVALNTKNIVHVTVEKLWGGVKQFRAFAFIASIKRLL